MMQIEWTWMIALALFFSGLGAGAYIASWATSLLWKERYKAFSRSGIFLSVPMLVLGTLLLLLDLGRPERAANVLGNPSSLMTIGATLLSVMIPISIVHSILLTGRFKVGANVPNILGSLGSIIGFGVALYTGILLGVLLPRTLWFSPLLPWLFVVSSLSTGVVAVSLLTYKVERDQAALRETIGRSERNHVTLLVLELLILTGYIASVEVPLATRTLLSGGLGALFLGGVLILGILVPLGLGAYHIKAKPGTVATSLTQLSFALVLLGGVLLRYTILVAGQL